MRTPCQHCGSNYCICLAGTAALHARIRELEASLRTAVHALRSYQYGNSAIDLAKEVANACCTALAADHDAVVAAKDVQIAALKDEVNEYKHDCVWQDREAARAEADELRRQLKNLAPIGRYNGKDIEAWYQQSEALRKALSDAEEAIGNLPFRGDDSPMSDALWRIHSAIERALAAAGRCTCGSGLADGLCANCWPL